MIPIFRSEISVLNAQNQGEPLVLVEEIQDEKKWTDQGWKYNFFMEFHPDTKMDASQRRFLAEALQQMADHLMQITDEKVREVHFMKK